MGDKKESRIKNCGSCGKPTTKLRRYYRDGKHFCNKRCYKKLKIKEKQEKTKKEA